MKKYSFIFTLLFSSLYVFSQQPHGSQAKRGQAMINDWYISAAGGAQLLFSEDAGKLDLGERMTSSFSLSGGKWFSPYWGVRLQVDGFALNGFSTLSGRYKADPLPGGGYGTNDPVREYSTIRPDGSYRHYIRYANATLGLQASLMNLITGYDESRKWDIIPSAGIGYFNTFEYEGIPSSGNLSGTFSLAGQYNVWKNIDVLLEVSTTLLPDKFEGRFTDRDCENILAARVGVVYNFKKAKSYKPLKRVCDLKVSDISFKKRKSKPAAQTAPVAQPKVIKEIVWNTDTVYLTKNSDCPEKIPFILSSIRFGLGKDRPISNQELNFINIERYLNDNPNARIRLDGYGDKGSGSEERNLKISIQRVNAVRKILIEKYHIDSNRIEGQAIGINVQPYEKNRWNRVVTVTVTE